MVAGIVEARIREIQENQRKAQAAAYEQGLKEAEVRNTETLQMHIDQLPLGYAALMEYVDLIWKAIRDANWYVDSVVMTHRFVIGKRLLTKKNLYEDEEYACWKVGEPRAKPDYFLRSDKTLWERVKDGGGDYFLHLSIQTLQDVDEVFDVLEVWAKGQYLKLKDRHVQAVMAEVHTVNARTSVSIQRQAATLQSLGIKAKL